MATGISSSHLSAATGSDGLLQGERFPDCEMYNDELTYWGPLEKTGYLLEAAGADVSELACTAAGYIKGLRDVYAAFLRSQYIVDRSELKSFLADAIVSLKSTGKVSIVWGPKSTGKTKLLESLCAQLSLTEDVLVVYINGRQRTLSHGIAEAIDKFRDNATADNNEHILQKIFESFSGVLNAAAALQVIQAGAATAASAAATGVAAMTSLLSAVKTLELCGRLETIQSDLDFLEGFLKFSQALGKHPSLVIDEANLIVTGDPSDQRLLSAICSHTKEHRAMNVTLCTSSHTYHHKLAALEGLQLQHTQIQYAAELSQKEMWHFLTGTIQMGTNLARACIAACGGNVFLVSDLLESAASPKFKILRGLKNIEGASSIQSLLQDQEIAQLLEKMAKKGYCLVPNRHSESAKKIIRARVAGIVDDDHVFPSELKNVLENDVYGTALVASSEALRHIILFEIKHQKTLGLASS